MRRGRRPSPWPDGVVSFTDRREIGWGWGGFLDRGAIMGTVRIVPSYAARIKIEASIVGAVGVEPL